MSDIEPLQEQAFRLHRDGQFAQAEQLYRQILASRPEHPPTLHLMGLLAFQNGRGDEALSHLQKAIACDPNQASYQRSLGEVYRKLGQLELAKDCLAQALRLDASLVAAHYSLGLLAVQQQDWSGAISALAEAVRLAPELVDAHDQLADAYLKQGRHEEALRHLQRVVDCRTNSAEAHTNLGNLQQDLGRLDEAIASFQNAARLRIDLMEARYNLGNALRAAGRCKEAVSSYRAALRLAPDFAPAYNNLGSALQELGHDEAAVIVVAEAVRLAPDSAEAHNNLGRLMKKAGKPAEAKALLARAIELNPAHAPSHFSLGGTLMMLRQREAARNSYLEALRLRPNYAEPHCGLGILDVTEGKFDEAQAQFETALAIQPDMAEAHCNRGMVLMLRAEFAAGWSEMEWRWKIPGAARPAGPAWDGEPLVGRTILLDPEQGRGDMLQFIRYARLIKARGGRVIVSCSKAMVAILSTCAGIDEFHDMDQVLPPFDVRAALLSLPYLCRTESNSIPADVPYLSAQEELVAKWRDALGDDGTFRVGINWQGSPRYEGDHFRSMPLAAFAPLADVEGVRLFSLQKGDGIEQLADAPFEIVDLGSKLDEGGAAFVETAAVIKNLDLVITSDTAVAHLAGALGAPVWVALPYSPDWRWLLDRQDSPWYPTLRLFRQPAPGAWKEVFERIAGELRKLVARAAASRGQAPPNRA